MLLEKEKEAKKKRNDKRYDGNDEVKELNKILNSQKMAITTLKLKLKKKKKRLENIYNYSS